MKRLAPVVIVLALAGSALALGACGSSDKKTSSGGQQDTAKACPPGAPKDTSYSGSFEGPVSMDQDKHVLRVTKDGRPVSGARVCIDTAMVGMTGMRYTATGAQLAPGRYRVGFKFGMNGTYRGSVVTQEGGKEVSIPVTVKVPSRAVGHHGK